MGLEVLRATVCAAGAGWFWGGYAICHDNHTIHLKVSEGKKKRAIYKLHLILQSSVWFCSIQRFLRVKIYIQAKPFVVHSQYGKSPSIIQCKAATAEGSGRFCFQLKLHLFLEIAHIIVDMLAPAWASARTQNPLQTSSVPRFLLLLCFH